MSKNHTEKDAFHFRTLNDKKNIYCLTWQYILVYQTWVQRVTSDLYEALKNVANNLQSFLWRFYTVYYNLVTSFFFYIEVRGRCIMLPSAPEITSLVSNVPMSFHFQSHNLHDIWNELKEFITVHTFSFRVASKKITSYKVLKGHESQ